MAGRGRIQVAVRVRPRNARESGQEMIVRMRGQTCKVMASGRRAREFSYGEAHHCRRAAQVVATLTQPTDHALWSADPADGHFVSQQQLYDRVVAQVVDNAFRCAAPSPPAAAAAAQPARSGYNGCVLAYGQTGSGKTYTMMGPESDPGVIPRLCEEVFGRIAKSDAPGSFRIEASYYEIYNDRVFDLLGDSADLSKPLRVREHNVLGPYVEGAAPTPRTSSRPSLSRPQGCARSPSRTLRRWRACLRPATCCGTRPPRR